MNTNPRDQEIIENATHYSIVQGRTRTTVATQLEAELLAAQMVVDVPRGVLVYAVGPACGVEASALLFTVKAK